MFLFPRFMHTIVLRQTTLNHQVYPLKKDGDGNVIGPWREAFEGREIYISAVKAHEAGIPKKQHELFITGYRAQEGVLYLIRRWNEKRGGCIISAWFTRGIY